MSDAPLALSLGEPGGIGPEIAVKAWEAMREDGPAFFAVGDAAAIDRASPLSGATVRIADPDEAGAAFADALPVIDRPLAIAVEPGQPSSAAAASVVGWIAEAARLTLEGRASALVTGPIAKNTLYEGGFAFPGHTEFLGQLAGAKEDGGRGPVMMLVAGDLRASLVTIHEPLARVPSLLTKAAIVNAGLVTARALQADFGFEAPRLAVAGLNPHAGEDGSIGREETETIGPAVAALRAAGVDARGPFPADSLFHAEARSRFDGALCLYHDQALIPAKLIDFWGGVNLTLGLAIVRASPDHGVALDIAGKGLARPDSLIAALRLAHDIAKRRARAGISRCSS
ncbi:MAG TPA: 4-hydroxythreonine-4-phosphate dehydrogenase PdxA [Caulobacteraceae bacterium]|nr:4-hydroxythreonine-4-phosphate dehydrogenase PdxA [Caulobacteraceae bacterium]